MHIVFYKLQFITINNSRTFWDLVKRGGECEYICNFWLKKILIFPEWLRLSKYGDVYQYIHVQAMLLYYICY